MLTEPLSCSTHTKCSTKGNQTNEFKKINNSKAKRHGAFHVFLSRISGTFVVNTSAVHMITIYWIKPRVVSVVWSSTLLPYLMQMKCWTSMPICNTVFRYKYIEQIKLSSSGYLSWVWFLRLWAGLQAAAAISLWLKCWFHGGWWVKRNSKCWTWGNREESCLIILHFLFLCLFIWSEKVTFLRRD